MSIFKACDIRGVYGEELTEGDAVSLGRALSTYAGTFVVGGDGRSSTPHLKAELIGALVEGGARVVDIGQVPTPAFHFARARLAIAAGVMVTASHNPPEDNGFKVVLGQLPLTEEEMADIRGRTEAGACGSGTGEISRVEVLDDYRAYIRSFFRAASRSRVVVDSGNGMMGPVAPGVFRAVGSEPVELFSEVDGRFPNRPPNPAVAANLRALCERVVEAGAAFGVAFDGDGDRVAFVDERGQVVENDRAIVLFARDVLGLLPGATIVYDQKASDVVREEVSRLGGVPLMERSGYAFIKTTMLATGAAYAGELSGHHFFGELGGDDGLFASLRMADIVATSGRPLSELVESFPRYPITPDIRLRVRPGAGKEIIAALRAHLHGATGIDERDGIRVQFPDGWGLARSSVTEPAITLRFEGRTEEALARIRRAFVEAAPQLEGRI